MHCLNKQLISFEFFREFSVIGAISTKWKKKLTFARINTHFHFLPVLLNNLNIHHNVQHPLHLRRLHHLRLVAHDTSQRRLSSGFGFDIYLDTMKLNRNEAALAPNSLWATMLAACTMEIPRALLASVAIANGANLHMRMTPENSQFRFNLEQKIDKRNSEHGIYFCILACLGFLFTIEMKFMHQKTKIIVKLRK